MVLAKHLYARMMRKGRVIALLALSSVPGLVFWLSAFDADQAEQEGALSRSSRYCRLLIRNCGADSHRRHTERGAGWRDPPLHLYCGPSQE